MYRICPRRPATGELKESILKLFLMIIIITSTKIAGREIRVVS